MSAVFILLYEGLLKSKDCIGFSFLIMTESLRIIPQRNKEREAGHMCFYNVIVWSNSTDYGWSAGTNLSLHSLFHWVEMIPSISSPLRAPSLHRSSFSPCMCALSIKRSISFRRPQGATSTLAQIGIAQSVPLPPLPFLHTRPPM